MQSSKETKSARKIKGKIYINAERCKGCGICIEFCPMKVLGFSDQYNAKGYHPPVVLHPDDCVGCNFCGMYCPDFAIYSVQFQNGNEKTVKENESDES